MVVPFFKKKKKKTEIKVKKEKKMSKNRIHEEKTEMKRQRIPALVVKKQ